MRPERGGSARRLACLTALGCLLGAATAAGTTLVSAAPAPAADCSAGTTAVVGARSSAHYGNRGYLYVNTQATVTAYNYPFVRSLLIEHNDTNWVEVGWVAHYGGHAGPQVFAAWDNAGTYRVYTPGIYPDYNSDRLFWTVNPPGGNPIFQFWFDNDSSPFHYSPTMNFGTAPPWGNSERHYSCQSLYADLYNLNDYTTSGWETWDSWDKCYNDSDSGNPYYMHRDSDTEFHVTATSPNNMTCSTTIP